MGNSIFQCNANCCDTLTLQIKGPDVEVPAALSSSSMTEEGSAGQRKKGGQGEKIKRANYFQEDPCQNKLKGDGSKRKASLPVDPAGYIVYSCFPLQPVIHALISSCLHPCLPTSCPVRNEYIPRNISIVLLPHVFLVHQSLQPPPPIVNPTAPMKEEHRMFWIKPGLCFCLRLLSYPIGYFSHCCHK